MLVTLVVSIQNIEGKSVRKLYMGDTYLAQGSRVSEISGVRDIWGKITVIHLSNASSGDMDSSSRNEMGSLRYKGLKRTGLPGLLLSTAFVYFLFKKFVEV